jgi:hypothetical protein
LMVGTGHAGFGAGLLSSSSDPDVIGGNDGSFGAGIFRSSNDMSNHGLAMDVGEGFSRKSTRCKARWNYSYEAHHDATYPMLWAERDNELTVQKYCC